MASGHTVMHLQRKLKDLQRQRCRRGGSQESRVLGMVAPTMRTPALGSPFIASDGTLHSHRGLQPHSPLARVAGRDLDDYRPVPPATASDDPKDPTAGTRELPSPAAELLHPGSAPLKPPPEIPQPRRAVPAATVPLSALTCDPWRADASQAFPVMPAIGFIPPARPPGDGPFFQRESANAAEFPPNREVLWPLPNYPAIFPDALTMPPSYQCPTYVPHLPLHPSWYRLDIPPFLYKKASVHPSELSAFPPLHLSHPLSRDTFGLKPSGFAVGPHSSSAEGRIVKEGAAIHKSKESKPVSHLPQNVLMHTPERLQRKEGKGQRMVVTGRTPSRDGGKPDKNRMVAVETLPIANSCFNRHRRGFSSSAPSGPDVQDLGQNPECHLWPWVSLQHTKKAARSNGLLVPGRPQHLTKEGQLSHVLPPVKTKLKDGLNRRDGEKGLAQVDSGSYLRHLLTEPRDSLKALDLSPKIQRGKYRDEHKATQPSPSRARDEIHQKGESVSSRGQQEDCSPAPAENEQNDTQGQRSARSSSMPNLLLTHSPHSEHERLKGFGGRGISTKEELQKKEVHLKRGSPRGGANLNLRVPGNGHLGAGGLTCTKGANETNPSKRALEPPATKSEESAQESSPAKTSRLGHCEAPANSSSCTISGSQESSCSAHCECSSLQVGGEKTQENAKRRLCGNTTSQGGSAERSPGGFPNQCWEEPVQEHDGYQDHADGTHGVHGQVGGFSILDLTTSSLSSDEETEEKPGWQGVEGVLEMYKSYLEETTFEEKILQEQLRLSKEKNNELSRVAKNLKAQIQDLQTSKEKLEAEQRLQEAALDRLRSCLVLV
ncbi:uncharacterized protein LOC108937515 isoform X2 [Scleropages formosus]|uniref:uncharacterized protein LOC108937515 isoform X2 n=1 Tax=Scleropages formosus TaxID=113540 RepID=UPI0010FA9494|nr:uncharacterized protein LOC108937515 isoform X2 [Scleropages formosus]